MALTRDDVRAVASLARLRLTDDEVVSLTTDLGHILDAFDRLRTLDTSAVARETPHGTVATPLREDRVGNPAAPDDLLSQAPAREDRYFRVPRIIE